MRTPWMLACLVFFQIWAATAEEEAPAPLSYGVNLVWPLGPQKIGRAMFQLVVKNNTGEAQHLELSHLVGEDSLVVKNSDHKEEPQVPHLPDGTNKGQEILIPPRARISFLLVLPKVAGFLEERPGEYRVEYRWAPEASLKIKIDAKGTVSISEDSK